MTAVINLREPLKIYAAHDREFRYMGKLRTTAITYLCPRHREQVDLPTKVMWAAAPVSAPAGRHPASVIRKS